MKFRHIRNKLTEDRISVDEMLYRYCNDGGTDGVTDGEREGITNGKFDGTKDGKLNGSNDGKKRELLMEVERMMEVFIEKLKGDLLNQKMERMKGEPMVQKKVQTMALSYNWMAQTIDY